MYVIVWGFEVQAECQAELEHLYGPEGEWVRLFRRGAGYLGSELHRSVEGRRHYLTLDRWRSQGHYEAFRQQHAAEYEALDRIGERLTEREVKIGTFVTLDGKGSA